MTRLLAVLALLCGLVLVAPSVSATPYLALHAGTPCATCHVNLQGGGGRTDIGFGAGLYNGAALYDQIGFNWLAYRETNDIVPGIVSFGYDVRAQSARIGAPEISLVDGEVDAALPQRRIFLMQLQPYLTIEPHETITLYATYSADRDTFQEGEACSEPFSGQSCYEAMAIVHPHRKSPEFRLGVLQPNIGIRHDDHTMYIRGDASRARAPVIAPNYADVGGDVNWTALNWLRVEAGAYWARKLSEAVGDEAVVGENDVAWNARIAFSPVFGRSRVWRFATLAGASVFGAGEFRMENVFAGIGLMNRASVLLEASLLHYGGSDAPSARNLAAVFHVQAFPWLIAHGRVEQGHAERGGAAVDNLALVGGFRVFPLPLIEIRPEYRHTWTDTYRTGQYTFQFRTFF